MLDLGDAFGARSSSYRHRRAGRGTERPTLAGERGTKTCQDMPIDMPIYGHIIFSVSNGLEAPKH